VILLIIRHLKGALNCKEWKIDGFVEK